MKPCHIALAVDDSEPLEQRSSCCATESGCQFLYQEEEQAFCFCEQMIEKNIRTNNEFYVCPVFNEAISDGKKIRVKEIERMWGIGTPEDLNYFLEHYKA
jgi:hypothetical protein